MRTRTAVVVATVAAALGVSVTGAVASPPGPDGRSAAAVQDMQDMHDQMGDEHAATMQAHMAGAPDGMMEDCADMGEHMGEMGAMGTGADHAHDHRGRGPASGGG